MTRGGDGPETPRVDAGSERLLPSRHRRVEPRLLDAGVYAPRPMTPLAEAVSRALGASGPGESSPGPGPAVEALWRRRRLRARLSSLLADHASREGARRILAADAPSLGLASPVAERLGLPLEMWREGRTGRIGGPAEPAAPPGAGPAYLVACVLRDDDAHSFLDGAAGGSPAAGAGAVARIREGERDQTMNGSILYIIEL